MKDRAAIANSGHFNVEIDIPAWRSSAARSTRASVSTSMSTSSAAQKRVYLLAEGRLINLAAAEGHPASVMDMSFATQALQAEWVLKRAGKLEAKVYDVPIEIEEQVCSLKLKAMGLGIDTLTPEQVVYLASSGEGT